MPPLLRVADLPQNRPTTFALRPDSAAMKAIAGQLGLLGLRKLSFAGEIRGEGRADWRLSAHLGATVVQPCVVTLDPVTTRVEADVVRLFTADLDDPDEQESEIPEDDTLEPLGDHIDLVAVMTEALALNMPLYPRSAGADEAETAFTEPGKTAMTDEIGRAHV